jgi:nicotinamide-nucleotide amidase
VSGKSRNPQWYVYTPALEDQAADLLRAAESRKLRIVAAESCTGGALAALLTDVEGLSHVFERCYVSYSAEAKQQDLGVDASLIAREGAVSKAVAEAMASGALARSHADLAVAITGNAGPAGPNDEPGLVFLCAAAGGRRRHEEHHFGNLGRSEVRIRTLEAAIGLLGWAVDSAQE